jgi:hypothetical protein
MNDFTKEELENIHNSIVMMVNLHDAPDEFFDLRDKIQSLIDNYCDHPEYKMIVNYDNDFVNVCVKCGS